MTLTKAQAKKYSLIKWDYARKTGCTWLQLKRFLKENHILIYAFSNQCGYCEKYSDGIFNNCPNCPLNKIWNGDCGDKGTLYEKWGNISGKRQPRKSTRKKYAEQIYQDIKRS